MADVSTTRIALRIKHFDCKNDVCSDCRNFPHQQQYFSLRSPFFQTITLEELLILVGSNQCHAPCVTQKIRGTQRIAEYLHIQAVPCEHPVEYSDLVYQLVSSCIPLQETKENLQYLPPLHSGNVSDKATVLNIE